MSEQEDDERLESIVAKVREEWGGLTLADIRWLIEQAVNHRTVVTSLAQRVNRMRALVSDYRGYCVGKGYRTTIDAIDAVLAPDREGVESGVAINVGNWTAGSADDLRAQGWAVAVHNDYTHDGEAWTFWILTHRSGRYLRGEAHSDAEALNQVRDALAKADKAGQTRQGEASSGLASPG